MPSLLSLRFKLTLSSFKFTRTTTARTTTARTTTSPPATTRQSSSSSASFKHRWSSLRNKTQSPTDFNASPSWNNLSGGSYSMLLSNSYFFPRVRPGGNAETGSTKAAATTTASETRASRPRRRERWGSQATSVTKTSSDPLSSPSPSPRSSSKLRTNSLLHRSWKQLQPKRHKQHKQQKQQRRKNERNKKKLKPRYPQYVFRDDDDLNGPIDVDLVSAWDERSDLKTIDSKSSRTTSKAGEWSSVGGTSKRGDAWPVGPSCSSGGKVGRGEQLIGVVVVERTTDIAPVNPKTNVARRDRNVSGSFSECDGNISDMEGDIDADEMSFQGWSLSSNSVVSAIWAENEEEMNSSKFGDDFKSSGSSFKSCAEVQFSCCENKQGGMQLPNRNAAPDTSTAPTNESTLSSLQAKTIPPSQTVATSESSSASTNTGSKNKRGQQQEREPKDEASELIAAQSRLPQFEWLAWPPEQRRYIPSATAVLV